MIENIVDITPMQWLVTFLVLAVIWKIVSAKIRVSPVLLLLAGVLFCGGLMGISVIASFKGYVSLPWLTVNQNVFAYIAFFSFAIVWAVFKFQKTSEISTEQKKTASS